MIARMREGVVWEGMGGDVKGCGSCGLCMCTVLVCMLYCFAVVLDTVSLTLYERAMLCPIRHGEHHQYCQSCSR
jgi:hypothetical protein